MATDDLPEPDDDFVDRSVMVWGLPGFVIGLTAINVAIYYLWRYALSFFYPGA